MRFAYLCVLVCAVERGSVESVGVSHPSKLRQAVRRQANEEKDLRPEGPSYKNRRNFETRKTENTGRRRKAGVRRAGHPCSGVLDWARRGRATLFADDAVE